MVLPFNIYGYDQYLQFRFTYENFKKRLRSTYAAGSEEKSSWLRPCRKKQKFSLEKFRDEQIFKNIMTFNGDDSFLKVSFVMKYFQFHNNDDFWQKYGEMIFKIPINDENLFSLLMHDWFDPEPGQDYRFSTKSEKYDEANRESVFTRLFELIDNPNCIYKNVVLRLLYQYLYEMERDHNSQQDDGCFKCIHQLKSLIFEVRDTNFKAAGIKIISVFWLIRCTNENIVPDFKSEIERHLRISDLENLKEMTKWNVEETTKFLSLCFLLESKENELLQFQKSFDKYLRDMKEFYGEFSEKRINHDVQLLSFLAEKKAPFLIQNFIFQKFPFIGINQSILTRFENVRAFTSFIVKDFDSKPIQKLVSSLMGGRIIVKTDIFHLKHREIFETRETFEKFESYLSKINTREAISDASLNMMIFGRKLKGKTADPYSVFELILETSGNGPLINHIWNKFGLATRREFLDLVSYLVKGAIYI